MNKMKKLLAVALLSTSVVGLVGCKEIKAPSELPQTMVENTKLLSYIDEEIMVFKETPTDTSKESDLDKVWLKSFVKDNNNYVLTFKVDNKKDIQTTIFIDEININGDYQVKNEFIGNDIYALVDGKTMGEVEIYINADYLPNEVTSIDVTASIMNNSGSPTEPLYGGHTEFDFDMLFD